ncbi:Asp23/Gls24 family envelope stress response protein, partial [Curtobacterium albidum]
MQHDPNARTQITEVDLPSGLTTPLPEDAGPLAVAARTAAETALGVPGVHHLGGLVARAADRVRSQLGRSAGAPGVQVDEVDGTLDVTVSLVVTYPQPVREVAEEVRRQVTAAVSQLGAGQTTTVDVRVLDVHGPFDDEPTAIDKAKDAVGDAVDRTKDAVTGAAENVREGAAEVAERAKDVAQDAADATREAAGKAKDAAGDVADRARDAAADAGDRIADAADTARERTADAVDAARSTASDAAERAAEKSSEAGDAAKDAVRAAKDAAVSASEEVRD